MFECDAKVVWCNIGWYKSYMGGMRVVQALHKCFTKVVVCRRCCQSKCGVRSEKLDRGLGQLIIRHIMAAGTYGPRGQ